MDFVHQYRQLLLKTLGCLDLAGVATAIEWFSAARAEDRQIFVCGNGGSAATASHFVTDMVKGASYNRSPRFRIQALTDSASTLTAYVNDAGAEAMFVEQLKNFARAGDLVMGISGSGNSPNVLRAIEYANSIGCRTLALTGRDGGRLGAIAQLNILVPEPHMGRIEDVHLILCHMICYWFMESDPGRRA